MSLLLLLRPAGLSVPENISPDPVVIPVEFPAPTIDTQTNISPGTVTIAAELPLPTWTTGAGIVADVVTIVVELPTVTITGADAPCRPGLFMRIPAFRRVHIPRRCRP